MTKKQTFVRLVDCNTYYLILMDILDEKNKDIYD